MSTQVKEKTGKCLDCGQFGHWKGDPECSRLKSGQTSLFKKHGANVLYFSIDDDNYDHAEKRTTVTPLYSNDPDEVLDWTPAEEDEEVTGWNSNPPTPIVNPPWVPYYVDWQPPFPVETDFRRIVDFDEFKNGTSDFIDPNIQDDDEDIHIQYIENSPGPRPGNRRSKKLRDRSRRREERDAEDVHKIDEHPLTTSQAEKMKDTIDEDISPEIPLQKTMMKIPGMTSRRRSMSVTSSRTPSTRRHRHGTIGTRSATLCHIKPT